MRWIIRALMGLVVLGALGIGVLLFLPAEKIAQLVEDRFQQATGRTMTVTGDIRPTIWPKLGVTTGAVTVANADWSDAGPMFQAQGLSVSVDLLRLIRGDIRVTGIAAQAPEILLERSSQGVGNWMMAQNAPPNDTGAAPSSGALPTLTIDKAEIKRGALRFIDRQSGADYQLSALDATFALPSMQGQTSFDISALINETPARVAGTIDGLAAFLERGAVPVQADATIGQASLGFDGRAGLSPLAAAGRLSGDFGDVSDVMAALGQPPLALPQGLGRTTVAMTGDITFTQTTLNLRDATVTLDKNTLSAAADVTLGGDRPMINAKLSAGALDLSGLSSSETGTGSQSVGWSTDAINVSGLQAVDAKLSVTASSIKIGGTDLGVTNLYTTLDAGRAVTEINRLEAYGGSIQGSVIVNSRGGLSTRINVSGSALAISKLFNELLGYDRLVATGDLSVNILGVGNDMNTLMNSLTGEGGFSTSAGELIGFDLVGMLRTLDPNFMGDGSRTVFDKISATFTINDGVLRNDDLSLLAPLLAATGSGQVGLGGQTLNYRLEPRLLSDSNLRVPILITGTWAAPRFKLDLESLGKEKLKEEARALEEKAKVALREKLEQELATPITDEQSVKDALKRKVEDKVRDGLLNILGGN